MKIEVLHYVVKVYQCGSLNKAAQELYLSQPNLSNAIRALEEELGYKLMIRNNKGIVFTEQGHQFLVHALNILNEQEKLFALNQKLEKAALRLGLIDSLMLISPFYSLLKEYEDCTNIDLTMQNLSQMEILNGVYENQLDIGCIMFLSQQREYIVNFCNNHHLEIKLLKKINFNYNFRKNHPIFEDGFSLEKLWKYPFVDYTDNISGKYHSEIYGNVINPQKIIRVNERAVRCQIVSITNAYSIGVTLPLCEQERLNLKCVPIKKLEVYVAYVHRKNQYVNEIGLRYIQLLEDELMHSA